MNTYQFYILEPNYDVLELRVQGIVEETTLAKALQKIVGDHPELMTKHKTELRLRTDDGNVKWVTEWFDD